jgi:hypothetical protein
MKRLYTNIAIFLCILSGIVGAITLMFALLGDLVGFLIGVVEFVVFVSVGMLSAEAARRYN